MADITNKAVINFSNEVVRPMSERIRDLKIDIDEALAQYFLAVSAEFAKAQTGDKVEDGRAPEGINQLTKGDHANFITQLQALQTVLNGGGVMDVIRKPNVRKLRG